MGWIKRNLFFVIGLVVTVLLLGAAAFYDFQSWRSNQDAFASLTEVYNQIQQDNNYKPSPGNDKIDNIQIAKDQQQQLQQWLKNARAYFQPITPIPNPADGQVTSEMFAPALSQTIRLLQHEAQTANLQLPPPPYFFSFTAQSDKAVFDSTTLGQVAQQLGDVKAIVEILTGVRVNELEGIQRMPVSKDDTVGNQADYLTDQPITKDMGVLTPYQVTFRGFSSDVANVLAAFASSPNGFIVQSISVQPASQAAATEGNQSVPGSMREGGPAIQYNMPAATTATMPGRGGLQTVLNEQMLRVTLKIEIIRLTPTS
ncbi:MAG TPA: Amuc_1100 family pilus-like protein [Verrucomicrobiae bacterium]|jgi:hypothetical protein